MRVALAVSTALVAAITSSGTAADDVALKWSLKEGDKFYATTVTEVNQTIGMRGQKTAQRMKMSATARFNVKSVKPGAIAVEITYLDVQVETSGVPQSLGIGEKLKSLTITATLNDDLEVVRLNGYEKVLDPFCREGSGTQKQIASVVSDGAVRQTFRQVFVPLPARPVAAGGKWDRQIKCPVDSLGELTAQMRFTLHRMTSGVATIKSTADLSLDPGKGTALGAVKVTRANLRTNEFAGLIQFDTKLGRLKESRTSVTLTGTISFAGKKKDVETGLQQTTVTTVTVTDKSPVPD